MATAGTSSVTSGVLSASTGCTNETPSTSATPRRSPMVTVDAWAMVAPASRRSIALVVASVVTFCARAAGATSSTARPARVRTRIIRT